MHENTSSIQEEFLHDLCERKIDVSIYLKSGIKLQGSINAFDEYAISLSGNTQQCVFKHAISTIVPTTIPFQKKIE